MNYEINFPKETIDENDEKAFYGSDDNSDKEAKEQQTKDKEKTKKPYTMDGDHRLLLRTTKPFAKQQKCIGKFYVKSQQEIMLNFDNDSSTIMQYL